MDYTEIYELTDQEIEESFEVIDIITDNDVENLVFTRNDVHLIEELG